MINVIAHRWSLVHVTIPGDPDKVQIVLCAYSLNSSAICGARGIELDWAVICTQDETALLKALILKDRIKSNLLS